MFVAQFAAKQVVHVRYTIRYEKYAVIYYIPILAYDRSLRRDQLLLLKPAGEGVDFKHVVLLVSRPAVGVENGSTKARASRYFNLFDNTPSLVK